MGKNESLIGKFVFKFSFFLVNRALRRLNCLNIFWGLLNDEVWVLAA